MTKLEAINRMLLAIGSAPVNAYINTGMSDAAIAAYMLESTSKRVQNAGWKCNTLHRYTLTPDSITNNVILPSATLRIIETFEGLTNIESQTKYTKRGNLLYDLTRRTFEFDADVILTIIEGLDFEMLTPSLQDYISIKAGREFVQSKNPSVKLVQFTQQDELMAYQAARNEEAEGVVGNLLADNEDGLQFLSRSVPPYRLVDDFTAESR